MKTMKIENAITKFFKDKEHYLAFRQSWKDFINNGHAKKKEFKAWDGSTIRYSELQCKYHLLYVLMIGKDGNRGFVEHTRGELYHYTPYNEAVRDIKSLRSVKSWILLEQIFGDTLNDQMIADLVSEFNKLS